MLSSGSACRYGGRHFVIFRNFFKPARLKNIGPVCFKGGNKFFVIMGEGKREKECVRTIFYEDRAVAGSKE